MLYSDKIANFDNTQAILDSATAGTEVWANMLTKVSDFMERRRNFWVSNLEGKEEIVNIKRICSFKKCINRIC